MPCSVRLYVSSNVLGKSFRTFRILAGSVRHSLSTWQTIHRNLQDYVSAHPCLGQGTRYEMTYMPSAFSDSVSTTRLLSSSFHLLMFRSERTTELMYLTISSFCPISSWSEIRRDVNGSRIARISVSGRLATHKCTLGSSNLTSSSTKSRTSSRA